MEKNKFSKNKKPYTSSKDYVAKQAEVEDSSPKPKQNSFIKEFTIQEPIGLLDFLRNTFADQSRTKVKSMLTNGQVYVDGVIQTQFDFLLQAKQKVQISKEQNRRPGVIKSQLDILYEDEEIIVINKPQGLLTIATEHENEKTAYHLLMDYVRNKNRNNRVFVLHRLDRETSGVLMIAKSPEIQKLFQEDWNATVTKRGYIALVEGTFTEQEGTYESFLTESSSHIVHSTKQESEGKQSITHYKIVRANKKYALLEVNLDTGRKNQIRVHLTEHGHPIVGDKKYGAISDPLRRLGLHANILEFVHPKTKKVMHFEAKIPELFYSVFK